MNITSLGIGIRATIERYGSLNSFSERLMEMGLTPGTIITIVRKAPFRGPIEISYGHLRLALRPSESDSIFVSPV